MGEAFAVVFIFIAVMSITLALFTGWLAVTAVRGVARLFVPIVRRRSSAPQVCGRCQAVNPPHARFCRRCGRPT